ncbi:hypothetical protein Vau01_064190 [Virgisporangium aurantiacum]|uniref:Beta-lactamase-related domain-containing protein n=2 Tax=Virgisporangium aurantiacum TaxID=175570 RepID=A0A8J4E2H4_9ACTN|nr:hypothetical protein Vau01_064190 [Virgisporangium aurantiacum]
MDGASVVLDQGRFDEVVRRHQVPGACLGVLVGDQVQTMATGVLHTGTGVGATVDSLFQIGSIAKAYTATMVMRLVEQGVVRLDSPVVEVLADFKVADPFVTDHVTLRHLLTHTSGIAGDFFHDTGRGDDCLTRYVADCIDLGQDHPLGATLSYCNTGYTILGRIIEVLTGTTWDQALSALVAEPLGLTHTWTLPEDALRFRAAMGHVTTGATDAPRPATRWGPPRSEGPCGLICASASDMLAFARLQLSDAYLTQMRQPQMAVPNPVVDHWGLGWMLWNWDGHQVFGHSGDTIGQAAYLLIVPDLQVAIVLLANSNRIGTLYQELFGHLLRELCGISMPAPVTVPAEPAPIDVERYVGVYRRVGTHLTVTANDDGGLLLAATPTGGLASVLSPYQIDLVPVTDRLFAGLPSYSTRPTPVTFDGDYLHVGVRAATRAA